MGRDGRGLQGPGDRAAYLAVKVLRAESAQDRIFLRRFEREARTLETLQHPHIVRFYGLEQEVVLAFMLMDYIEGTTLRAEIFKLNWQPMKAERILEIIRPICSGLHYAHKKGLIHCDLKPGNIMINKFDQVLIGDFGIARMTDAATATMIGIGTPSYMSPEQIRGQNPTPQTDIYALGIVLYEILAGGERPFTGEHADTTGSTGQKNSW